MAKDEVREMKQTRRSGDETRRQKHLKSYTKTATFCKKDNNDKDKTTNTSSILPIYHDTC